ncbi:MAG: dipicolinate synthase subunit DpsA [Clostridia bacterium]|nr:dipicolinate synthase subunit DpsA [Clostridia bacterium]
MTMKNYAVVGGDKRCALLAELLAKSGNSVHAYALDKYNLSDAIVKKPSLASLKDKYDCVLLPLPLQIEAGYLNAPFSINTYLLDDVFSLFPPGQKVVAGKVPHSLFEKAGRLGVALFDYLEREEFSVSNAIPSAEGAIQIALEKLPITLNRANCLILGNGRIGKVLSQYLAGFGAKVCVSARKYADFAWISAFGNTPLPTGDLTGKISGFDVVFNTIPRLVLDEKLLRELKPEALIIDLASSPGGVDLFAAKELDREVVWALSLPGKAAPLTAAEIMMTTVQNILEEWGYGK